ncbi:DUF3566 domain-containing protein [Myceligenerans crystallogenes]|uniref:DUF3566 domain-containing protein n=1 Tax=Myceligenerans crystallogenes TaxID=316335 RepID=A0ABN2NGB4_9MICO
MTSSNHTGQGPGSTTAEIGGGQDPARPADAARDSASADDAASASGIPVGVVSADPSGVAAARNEPVPNRSGVPDVVTGDSTEEVEKPAGGTVSEKVAEPVREVSSAIPVVEAGGNGASKAAPPSSSGDGAPKPIPGGFWKSAYEAGAAAPSSRYTSSAAEAEVKDPSGKAESTPSLGSAIVNATNPVGTTPGAAEVDDTTKPRRDAAPAGKPSDEWQRVPAAEADKPAGAGAAAAGAAAGAAVAGAGAAAASDTAANVKQGAVKAAQAALAAARNAAKKVSSAMPDATTATAPSETPAAPPAPPEMHYTAGAVRGKASVADEAASPVTAGTTPKADAGSDPASGATPRPASGPRRVRLAISRIDPWSVMKLAFLLSVAIAIMTVVATAVFWSVIDSLGVFKEIETFVNDAIGTETEVNFMQYVEFERVVSLATLIAICNVVLLTALATIMTFLYNITAALVGGVHMTLTDD